MQKLFILFFFAVSLVCCATQKDIREDFEKNYKNYNELVRWRQFDDASSYPADSISGEYQARLNAAKNVVVVDYRVTNIKYDEKMKMAEVKVEIDYYTLFSSSVRTLTDNQRWSYQGKEGEGHWRLMSLLPVFP